MFFERPDTGELAVLVNIILDSGLEPENPREFEELVLSAGGDPVAEINGHRRTPNGRYFVGAGKLEEIREVIAETGAQLVIFNHNLKPLQQRNVEAALCCRVIDRTGLILDIFAQRAHTHEGKLQVELAQLEYMSTRLIRGWTHLERQKGGIGLRGPGETQLETDRRLLRARIKIIRKRLEKVKRRRRLSRSGRERSDVPTVTLVGYTNAGKSSLFNALTDAGVLVEDKLFATLDPTMRAVKIPVVGNVVFGDTVGFVSHLPHKLVDAFRATLEEATKASLLLHVIDVASDQMASNITEVEGVLAEIDAADVPVIKVYNKIDLQDGAVPGSERDSDGSVEAVWLSAQSGAGLDSLLQAIQERLINDVIEITCRLSPRRGRLRAKLYEAGVVIAEHNKSDGDTMLDVRIASASWQRLLRLEGLTADQVVVASATDWENQKTEGEKLALAT